MCHLGISELIIVKRNSVFCARWTSEVQGFGFPKLLTRKGVSYPFYSEICGLQEQMGVADFSRITRPKSEQDLHH